MNTFSHRYFIFLSILIVFALAACATMVQSTSFVTPAAVSSDVGMETAVALPSPSPSPTTSPTPTQTATPLPTSTTPPTQTPTNTPQPTATVIPSFLETNLVYAETRMPEAHEPISAANFQQLTHVAQWGNGSILGVAFAPDGRSFLVGSAVGFNLYEIDTLPRWVPWSQPFFYESASFSTDGQYVLLENRRESRIYRATDGQQVFHVENVTWINSSKRTPYNDQRVVSGDWRFESYSTFDEENMSIEIVVQEMYDNVTGDLLYQFDAETMYVQYRDYHEPEGCDLNTFSMCGNAFDPSAMEPYRAAFSPTNETISILYRAPNLGYSNEFSLLKVYRVTDGQVMLSIGDFTHPVETFAYSPDGQSLLIGYGDGLIELKGLGQNGPLFESWHFDEPIIEFAYSFDGKYLVVQRPDWLEVRRTDTGAMHSRKLANAFALSPVANQIALGMADGTLILYDMSTNEPVYTVQAHAAKIYALAFSPEGDVLVSSGEDCRVQSWDANTGNYLHDFAENITDAYEMGGTESRIFIKNMTYIAGTDQLLGYGSWSRVVSWEAVSGDTRYMIEPEPLEYYNGMITLNPHFPEFLEFNPNNQSFLIDYVEYDMETGERLGEYQPPDSLPVGCASVGPMTTDGMLLFTRGYDTREGQVCILDATDFHLIQAVQISDSAKEYDPIGWLYLSPDGKQLVISAYSGVLNVYQIVR